MSGTRANYGLDAPGIVIRQAAFGALFAILFLASHATPSMHWARGCIWPAGTFFVAAGLMLWSSYFGKFRARDRLLAGLHLRGDETLVDLGCGRGLLLVRAAQLLPRGRAIGVDLWSRHDLSGNSRHAVEKNADIEGVKARVQIVDGDMRKLPFADGTIDAVVASMSIHNIASKEGRRDAVKEAIRVLKPGGKFALLDFQCTKEYEETCRDLGLASVTRSLPSFWNFPPSRTVGGTK